MFPFHISFGGVMAADKPWALISEVGENGCSEDLAVMLKEHFQIVSLCDLLENPDLHGPKIQVLFMWKFYPEATPALLSLLPSLRVVCSAGTGTDHLNIPYIHSLGVKIANTPHVVSDATADFAMGLLLASARKIFEGQEIARDPNAMIIPQTLMGVEVTGSTLGIIGMGEIGYKIAKRSKGFDMKILYHNRNRRSAVDEAAVGATYCENLNDLLKMSDFVMLSLRFTPESIGLIGRRELSLMKPTATLINMSRGLVIDQDALVQALQSGTIQAAALDVTYPEPLPRDHPLLYLPNALITPHMGISSTNTAKKIVQKMVDNALAAVKGLPIPDEVDPQCDM
uniref:Glyoxylate reductase/hydroxypyruvate reductase n=1 Tax=Periophthalmus magnuspinnatus TaxID=409849 RepID=A0A3B4BGA8_9GOBI